METLWTVAGLQAILLAVQLGSLVWKKKGDADPAVATLKKEVIEIQKELKASAEALVRAEQRMADTEGALRLSAAKDLSDIKQGVHEVRVGIQGVLITMEGDRTHFNEAVRDLREVVKSLDHNIRGDGVPGLMQRQAEDDIKIEHLEEDIKQIKSNE